MDAEVIKTHCNRNVVLALPWKSYERYFPAQADSLHRAHEWTERKGVKCEIQKRDQVDLDVQKERLKITAIDATDGERSIHGADAIFKKAA